MARTGEVGSSSAEDEDANHVAETWEVSKDRLSLMQRKISDPPRLLKKAAANSSCCIFKVPQRFIDINGGMLSRTQDSGVDLEVLLKAIQPLEMKARECYSQIIHLETCEFVEMMVLDGVFIIELFRKVGNVVRFEVDDPIVTTAWIMPFFYRDLLRLENQIPLCYLSELFSDVHRYYKNTRHLQWASFKYTYFRTPWSFVSALAALIILLLTVAQTFYTIYGTYRK
uniref:Uncharacterized protein n=1 Tax=Salix viminalis TaxID=40686 RepID=A0A6N2LQY6_SALVM